MVVVVGEREADGVVAPEAELVARSRILTRDVNAA